MGKCLVGGWMDGCLVGNYVKLGSDGKGCVRAKRVWDSYGKENVEGVWVTLKK